MNSYASLNMLLREISEPSETYANKPVKSQTYSSTCVMLYPTIEDAARIVKELNLHPSWVKELHTTLVFVGAESKMDNDTLIRGVQTIAADVDGPIKATLNGVGRFNGNEEDGDPIILNVDSKELDKVRIGLMAQGVQSGSDHGFTPHMTIAYVEPGENGPFTRLPSTIDVTFDRIGVSDKGDITFVPLGTANEIKASEQDDDDRVDTMGDEYGERVRLNSRRRRSFNMSHLEKGR